MMTEKMGGLNRGLVGTSYFLEFVSGEMLDHQNVYGRE
jgi:hypothetical protein